MKASAANGALASEGRAHLFVGLQVDAHDGRNVERRRQEVDDRVEQGLNALVLERGAADDRRARVGDAGLAQRGLDLVDGDGLVLEHLHHELVVGLRGDLDELLAVDLGVVRELGGNLADRRVDAVVVLVEEDRVHLEQVDDADEGILGADRELDRHGVSVEAIAHHPDDVVEVGTRAVHLVDVGDAGNAVRVRLAPDRLGLGLDATDSTEHRDSTVEDAQRALDLDREVDVTRACR